jgi:two-component system response regulator HupR/HoxA
VGRLENDVLDLLMNYSWPGNVRQLENEIKKMVTFISPGADLTLEYVSEEIRNADQLLKFGQSGSENSLKGKVANLEKELILRELKKNKWNKSKTAAALGLSRKGLDKKVLRYGLDRRIKQGKRKV